MEGRVLTVDGFPAAGIRVTLKVAQAPEDTTQYYSEDARSVTTSHLGTYRLHGIPAGRYYIAAGPPGLLTYFPGVLSVSDAEPFAVVDGTILRHDFRLACRLDLKVSGRVIFASENSWRVQTVGLISRTIPRRHRKVRPDGSFEFTEVPPGSYSLSCGDFALPGHRHGDGSGCVRNRIASARHDSPDNRSGNGRGGTDSGGFSAVQE